MTAQHILLYYKLITYNLELVWRKSFMLIIFMLRYLHSIFTKYLIYIHMYY